MNLKQVNLDMRYISCQLINVHHAMDMNHDASFVLTYFLFRRLSAFWPFHIFPYFYITYKLYWFLAWQVLLSLPFQGLYKIMVEIKLIL